MHLRFSAQAFDVGRVLALIGADGTPECFVIREDGAEAEGKHSG
jgi:hypothetical protein